MLKNMPRIPRNTLESLLEALVLVLLADAYARNVNDLADKDEADPAGECAAAARDGC